MVATRTAIDVRYFNSIKVRLEHPEQCRQRQKDNQFQFHKGTIRTSDTAQGSGTSATFQFHKGTIRTH